VIHFLNIMHLNHIETASRTSVSVFRSADNATCKSKSITRVAQTAGKGGCERKAHSRGVSRRVASANAALPFVNWFGGKRRLLAEIQPRMPLEFRNYWEPFVGGGAMFWALQERDARVGRERGYHLSDMNAELINAYRAVAENPDPLIHELASHAALHQANPAFPFKRVPGRKCPRTANREGYYFTARAKRNYDASQGYHLHSVDAAARWIYLMRACFNGCHKLNAAGEFVTGPGDGAADMVREQRMRACSQALAGVELRVGGYQQVLPGEGDFVYLDPPYDPLNPDGFTSYMPEPFEWPEQQQLAEFVQWLRDERGAHVAVSNHATPRILELYKRAGLRCYVFAARRTCGGAGRNGSVAEVLATTYQQRPCAHAARTLPRQTPRATRTTSPRGTRATQRKTSCERAA
jgi:DNA adenine methylase